MDGLLDDKKILVQKGDTVTLRFSETGRTETYRIGDENQPAAKPPMLGIGSDWGSLLKSKGISNEVMLSAPEGNVVMATVVDIIRG